MLSTNRFVGYYCIITGTAPETLPDCVLKAKEFPKADEQDAVKVIDKYKSIEPATLFNQKFMQSHIDMLRMGITGTANEALPDVYRFVSNGEPVFLTGPAGTGKSYMAEQIAQLTGSEFYSTGAVLQPYDLIGFIDAKGNYQQTEFYKACKSASEGKKVVFLFDEIDASSAEALVKFNNALANAYFEFPAGKLSWNKNNLQVIACANTFGLGADAEYVGRTQLDAATLDRFAVVPVGYSPAIEATLTDDTDLLEMCRALRESAQKNYIHMIVSYRGIIRLSKMLKCGMDTETAWKACIIKNLQPDDLNTMINDLPIENKYFNTIKKIAKGN